MPRFSIRIETRFENNNGSNNNVSTGLSESKQEVEKDRVIKEGGKVRKTKGKREIAIFSAVPRKNVHQIDVAITRKTSKAQNALLADLLTRCAGCWSLLPCCTLCTATAHKHTQTDIHKQMQVYLVPEFKRCNRGKTRNKNQHVRIQMVSRETLLKLLHATAGLHWLQYLQTCNLGSLGEHYEQPWHASFFKACMLEILKQSLTPSRFKDSSNHVFESLRSINQIFNLLQFYFMSPWEIFAD